MSSRHVGTSGRGLGMLMIGYADDIHVHTVLPPGVSNVATITYISDSATLQLTSIGTYILAVIIVLILSRPSYFWVTSVACFDKFRYRAARLLLDLDL